MSETPMTDEKTYAPDAGDFAFVDASFARRLKAELAEARGEIERLNKQLDEFWERLDFGWEIEPREELEKIAKDQFNPPNPLAVALRYIWKREVKTPEKDKLIEQMREALDKIRAATIYKDSAPKGTLTQCHNIAVAAIEAAERSK